MSMLNLNYIDIYKKNNYKLCKSNKFEFNFYNLLFKIK